MNLIDRLPAALRVAAPRTFINRRVGHRATYPPPRPKEYSLTPAGGPTRTSLQAELHPPRSVSTAALDGCHPAPVRWALVVNEVAQTPLHQTCVGDPGAFLASPLDLPVIPRAYETHRRPLSPPVIDLPRRSNPQTARRPHRRQPRQQLFVHPLCGFGEHVIGMDNKTDKPMLGGNSLDFLQPKLHRIMAEHVDQGEILCGS